MKKKRPRFIQRLIAFFGGYFWLPCPICGEMFGGHEWAGSLMTSWNSGRGVCPDCAEEAERRNEEFMEIHDPPEIYVDAETGVLISEEEYEERYG